jgi:putative addiction module component (TIGR02574 family)
MYEFDPNSPGAHGKFLNGYYEDVYNNLPHMILPAILIFAGSTVLLAIKRNSKEKKMATADRIFKEASSLSPSEKAQLIDKLISTLDKSDKEIDELWAKEAEDRIDAYDQGKIKAISLEKVLQKYR